MPNIDDPLLHLWATPKTNSTKSTCLNMSQPTSIGKPQQGHGTLDAAKKCIYIYINISALLSTLLVSILHRRLANLRYPANEVYLKLLSGWFRTEQISLICFPMVSGCLFDRGQFISKEELRRCTVGSLHGSSIQPEHPLFRRNRPLFRRKPPQLVWNCELSTYFLRFWWCYHDLSRIHNITLGRKYRLGLKIQVPIFWVSWSAVTCWIILGGFCGSKFASPTIGCFHVPSWLIQIRC